MQTLLWIANRIDYVNDIAARVVRWSLLANALLLVGNAVSRKLFSVTILVAYDLQWHFFAATVLLMAAYTLQRDEHVRVDVFAHRLSERGLAWLDLVGITLILLPLCAAMIWVTTPTFIESLFSGETRASRESVSDLPAWIIKSFIPVGFTLLAMQGIAEAIRCVAALKGLIRRPMHRHQLIEGRQNGN